MLGGSGGEGGSVVLREVGLGRLCWVRMLCWFVLGLLMWFGCCVVCEEGLMVDGLVCRCMRGVFALYSRLCEF